jgi:CDP-glucose 4,6-dehydratase
MFLNKFAGKKVLVTGHTGFKGSWLVAWLLRLGANVSGISDCVPTSPAHFNAAKMEGRISHHFADIRDLALVIKIINEEQPDFVFHLAAQPLVRRSYREPHVTIETNVMGTANVLEALRLVAHPCTAIVVTSDKCYDNIEQVWGYRENDALGGKDPYSASKGAAELVVKTYAHSYFSAPDSPVKVAVGRAGNVIGGGDWAEDRIVPDCVRAWSRKEAVEIRYPKATRPWQHVLEPLSGYLMLAVSLSNDASLNGEPYNFGPLAQQNFTVAELLDEIKSHWPGASWEDISGTSTFHEAGLLKLCCDKALHQIGWRPVMDFAETVRLTSSWYRSFYEFPDNDVWDQTQMQIAEYESLARCREIKWVLA